MLCDVLSCYVILLCYVCFRCVMFRYDLLSYRVLGAVVSDSDVSSRSASQSPSPRIKTAKQSPTSILNEKLSAYLDLQIKQQQQQQQSQHEQQVIPQSLTKKLTETYGTFMVMLCYLMLWYVVLCYVIFC